MSIRWSYDGNEYVTGFDTYIFQQDVFRSGNPKSANYWQWRNMPECEGTVNRTTNVITWKVLKSNIGNPEKGDVLTNTRAAQYLVDIQVLFIFSPAETIEILHQTNNVD